MLSSRPNGSPHRFSLTPITYVQYTLPTTGRQPVIDYKCCGLFAGYVLPFSALKSPAGTRAALDPPSRHVFEPSFGSPHTRAARRTDPCCRSAAFGFLQRTADPDKGTALRRFLPFVSKAAELQGNVAPSAGHFVALSEVAPPGHGGRARSAVSVWRAPSRPPARHVWALGVGQELLT